MTAQATDLATRPFRYEAFDIDTAAGALTCVYSVGGRSFRERITVEGADWDAEGVEDAAYLVFLLTGVSYYKAFAPPVIDLGSHPTSAAIRALLRDYYIHGLGEFAYRNNLDLADLQFVGGCPLPEQSRMKSVSSRVEAPLVPFGGGMDSIVSVELIKELTPDAALFVVNRPNDQFDAIEDAAAVTGLPITRATRELDPAILRSRELGFLNGHVPVTGVLSAIAMLAGVTTHRDAVVMSNEWSASSGNIMHFGQLVNHQYSKSLAFEQSFRAATQSTPSQLPMYFSLLRPFSELWIARRFADLSRYHSTFRSCNRAFHIDPKQRLDHWCGRCDKCAFIDLVLSPFMSHAALDDVFEGLEPLDNAQLIDVFRTLIGTSASPKPFECVGDVDECRAAILLACERGDRTDSPVLSALRIELEATQPASNASALLSPMGPHFVPEPYASDLRLA